MLATKDGPVEMEELKEQLLQDMCDAKDGPAEVEHKKNQPMAYVWS
jgi:hypothetical protein